MLNLNSVSIGSANPAALADFYTNVLGKPDWSEGTWYGWQAGNSWLHIGEHSEVKGVAKEPQRILRQADHAHHPRGGGQRAERVQR